MKTAKDQKINYLKYEKEHRKPAMSRLLTAACLLWMFWRILHIVMWLILKI